MTVHVTRTEDETAQVGRELARLVRPGVVIALTGPLGAGKTAFVRGLAEGLGCDPGDVSSPTFTLIQQYHGTSVRLDHIDLYRLKSSEVDDLLIEELLEEAAVAIEWPDRWLRQPADTIEVRIDSVSDSERRITVDDPSRP